MLCELIRLTSTASLKETRRGLPRKLVEERRALAGDLRELLRGDKEMDSMVSSRSLRDRWCPFRVPRCVPERGIVLLLALPSLHSSVEGAALRALELRALDSSGLALGATRLRCRPGLLSLLRPLLLLVPVLPLLLVLRLLEDLVTAEPPALAPVSPSFL